MRCERREVLARGTIGACVVLRRSPGFGESTPRVATVALNPSRREFPAADPFKRFPGAESPDDASYLRSLFGYFRTAPYVSWFDFYEQALLGIGTSYYGNSDAVALHTDIGSVLATDPTWSGLDAPIREQLAQAGVPLWHRLVEHLKPNILLWSNGTCVVGADQPSGRSLSGSESNRFV